MVPRAALQGFVRAGGSSSATLVLGGFHLAEIDFEQPLGIEVPRWLIADFFVLLVRRLFRW